MYRINTESMGGVKKYIWHYRKGSKEYGPFTYEEIVELVRKGEIGPEDYVLKFGNKKFIKASEVQGLFDVMAQPVENQEETLKIPEEDHVVEKEETKRETAEGTKAKEEKKDEYQVIFEHSTARLQAKYKKRTRYRNALIIVAAAVLCIIAWLLARFL